MLKSTLLFTAALLALASPSAPAQNSRPCQVTGNIKGLGNKPVVFVYEQKGHQYRDTVRAVNDRFTYASPLTDDGTIYLKLIPTRLTNFWSDPGQKVMITGSMAEPSELAVLGSPDNDLLTRFKQQVGWKFDRRIRAHPDSMLALLQLAQQPTLDFIKAHPRSRTSADLLYSETRHDDKPLAEYEMLLGSMSASVQASPQGQNVARQLQAIRNQPAVGRPAPAFTMPDTAGIAVSLDRFKGQYVLLDFWGHWCGPCIRAMPHLKQIQAQYGQQLAVVGIGMEHADDKQNWLNAIRKHRATWTQLSELNTDKGTIEQYNIKGFPSYVLLDKQGTVLDISMDLGPIEEKLKALLAKP